MTTERIRIKVAEAMGWKHPEYGYMQNAWRESNGSWHFGSNVLDDLNACAEFEAELFKCEILWLRYRGLIYAFETHNDTAFATALQRCEAYLRVKGLWEESLVPDKPPLSPTADTHAANKAANHRTGCVDNA